MNVMDPFHNWSNEKLALVLLLAILVAGALVTISSG